MTVHLNLEGKAKRERSTIEFPYTPLDEAISLVRTVLSAGGSLDRDQLAAQLGQTTSSGSFNNKVSAAQMFGLLEVANGRYQPSDLGYEVLDASRERAAKAEAFLRVPLYRRLYDDFKGKQLPPRPEGLERAIVNLGVGSKRGADARSAFDRSARSAGFFPNSAEDRLVQPVIVSPAAGVREAMESLTAEVVGDTSALPKKPMASAYDIGRPRLHPFIEGLLDELPEKGADWGVEQQANWLQAAAQIFRLLYRADGEVAVTVSKGRFPPSP